MAGTAVTLIPGDNQPAKGFEIQANVIAEIKKTIPAAQPIEFSVLSGTGKPLFLNNTDESYTDPNNRQGNLYCRCKRRIEIPSGRIVSVAVELLTDRVSRQDSIYKRQILEFDGVNMRPRLGWGLFVDLPRDSIKFCYCGTGGLDFAVKRAWKRGYSNEHKRKGLGSKPTRTKLK